jgi:CheY-like chemotaxis protein
MHMPGMDGFDLVDQIRRDPGLTGAKIIMLTSGSHRGDIEHSKSLGISAFLSKPIRQADLRDALLRVLGAGMNRPEPAAARVPISPETLRPAPSNVSLDILLAEDNAVNQLVATRLLQKRNHQVVVAANGLQALEAFNRGSFDLIFMDVQMPEMDGMEATARIRAQERLTGGHQTIVALTAHSMKGDRERCLDSGMDDYLTKPISSQDLDAVLSKYSREKARPQTLSDHPDRALASVLDVAG